MMNGSDAWLLRRRLWQVNVEYSALVRKNAGEGRFVRLAELTSERHALMRVIATGSTSLMSVVHDISPSGAPIERLAAGKDI